MKKLLLFSLLWIILANCNTAQKNTGFSVFYCQVIDIKEYEHVVIFAGRTNGNDTLIIESLKIDYTKKGFQKKLLYGFEKIELNNQYAFYLRPQKVRVSTMEQLGAFIIVESDTLYESSTYKTLPLFFRSYNTIGRYHSKYPLK